MVLVGALCWPKKNAPCATLSLFPLPCESEGANHTVTNKNDDEKNIIILNVYIVLSSDAKKFLAKYKTKKKYLYFRISTFFMSRGHRTLLSSHGDYTLTIEMISHDGVVI